MNKNDKNESTNQPKWTPTDIRRFFVIRDDDYAEQWSGRKGQAGYLRAKKTLTDKDLEDHLAGGKTVGVYAISPDQTVKFGLFDTDKPDQIGRVLTRLRSLEGIEPYPEASGSPGHFHVWIFTEEMPSAQMHAWLQKTRGDIGVDCEIFPKQASTSGRGKELGNLIKLPFGINLKHNNPSTFKYTPDEIKLSKIPVTTYEEVTHEERAFEEWDREPEDLKDLPCYRNILTKPGPSGQRHPVLLRNLVAMALRTYPRKPKERQKLYGIFAETNKEGRYSKKQWVREADGWEKWFEAKKVRPLITKSELEPLGYCSPACMFCGKKTRCTIDHLPHIEDVSNGLGLEGEDYNPVRMAAWYNLVSHAIRKSHIQAARIRLDPRIALLAALKSDYGKGNLKKFAKAVVDSRAEIFKLCTSVHPEALVGKIKQPKPSKRDPKAEPIEIPGALSADYVFIDESLELFRSEQPIHKIAMGYIRQACDTYGENNMEKIMVDVGIHKTLNYCPHCSITFCMQPLLIKAESILVGNLRRFLVEIIESTVKKRLEQLFLAGEREDDPEPYAHAERFAEWTKGLTRLHDGANDMPQRGYTWGMTPEAKKRVSIETGRIVQETWMIPAARGYIMNSIFTLRNYLIKMSCCQAACRHLISDDSRGIDTQKNAFELWKIREEDVEIASKDLRALWRSTIGYVSHHVEGTLSYDDKISGLNEDHQRIMRWLIGETKGKNLGECPSVDTFIQTIINLSSSIEESSARRIPHILAKKGLLETKQIGRHDWRVRATVTLEGDEEFPGEFLDNLIGGLSSDIRRPEEKDSPEKKGESKRGVSSDIKCSREKVNAIVQLIRDRPGYYIKDDLCLLTLSGGQYKIRRKTTDKRAFTDTEIDIVFERRLIEEKEANRIEGDTRKFLYVRGRRERI